ncbi:unnamed protein product [Arctogadus glacialis]
MTSGTPWRRYRRRSSGCANGYPEGLPIQEIHGLYQRTYGKPLRLGTPKRFAPLQTLLRSVPDISICAPTGRW